MRSSNRARALFAVFALAAFGSLASCGSGEELTVEPTVDGEQTTETEEPTKSVTEDMAAETEAESAETLPEGATAPGTELAIGDQATVQTTHRGKPGLINVMVTSIDEGDPADLDSLELGDEMAGLTPYYVNLEIEGADASAEALSYATVDGSFGGLLADGAGAVRLGPIGDFEPCDSSDLGEFGEGKTATTCIAFLARGETMVTGATYLAFDSPYAVADGQPLIWSQ